MEVLERLLSVQPTVLLDLDNRVGLCVFVQYFKRSHQKELFHTLEQIRNGKTNLLNCIRILLHQALRHHLYYSTSIDSFAIDHQSSLSDQKWTSGGIFNGEVHDGYE